mmetsp:Transcript_62900/g.149934  ORF Transcript_62900/g.149934 Transcript_62900/m.149934 type:complete len:291 (+) Transcript_62900:391-1263(+)
MRGSRRHLLQRAQARGTACVHRSGRRVWLGRIRGGGALRSAGAARGAAGSHALRPRHGRAEKHWGLRHAQRVPPLSHPRGASRGRDAHCALRGAAGGLHAGAAWGEQGEHCGRGGEHGALRAGRWHAGGWWAGCPAALRVRLVPGRGAGAVRGGCQLLSTHHLGDRLAAQLGSGRACHPGRGVGRGGQRGRAAASPGRRGVPAAGVASGCAQRLRRSLRRGRGGLRGGRRAQAPGPEHWRVAHLLLRTGHFCAPAGPVPDLLAPPGLQGAPSPPLLRGLPGGAGIRAPDR